VAGATSRRRRPTARSAVSDFFPCSTTAASRSRLAPDRRVGTKVPDPRPRPPALPEFFAQLPAPRRRVMHHLCETGCTACSPTRWPRQDGAVIALLESRPMTGRRHLVVCPASVVPGVARGARAGFIRAPRSIFSNRAMISRSTRRVHLARQLPPLGSTGRCSDSIEFGIRHPRRGQFIKNPDAKVTQACFAIKTSIAGLTGTRSRTGNWICGSIFVTCCPACSVRARPLRTP